MNIKSKYTLLVLFVLQTLSIAGQNAQVWLHGKIVNHSDSLPIPLAQLAAYENINLFAADSLGEFRITLSQSDSLKVVALGFEARVFHLDSLNLDSDEVIILPLHRTSYQIQQVDINFYKGYSDYTTALKRLRSKQMEMNLGLPADIKLGRAREIPADIQPIFKRKPPVYAILIHPLSFIYYHTSKVEKQKVRMVQLLKDEKQRSLLSRELIQDISGYKSKELERFMMYCNANIKFTGSDTEISIKYKVIDLLNAYKKEAH